jgi:hypothetical protein
MSRIILTVGFIPSDWSGASDGSKIIMVGDVDHSKTFEYEYEVGDNDFKNITTGLVIGGSMIDTYNAIGKDSEKLSKNFGRIPTMVLQNIYEISLEEAEQLDSFINLYEEGISEFTNNRGKYNGCFYCRYLVEDDGEIEKELLFVVKKK